MKDWIPEASLVMLSGGIDSAYMLYQQLTETELPIHAHHIVHRTKTEPRADVENFACQRIVKLLQEYVRPFTYSTSAVNTQQFTYPGWDTDTQMLMGIRVAANMNSQMTTLMLGITADDTVRPDIQDRIKRNVLPNLWKALHQSIDKPARKRINDQVKFPIIELTKVEIFERIPEDLLELTWSCRRPIREGVTVRPCGRCHACRLNQTSSS